MLWVSAVNADFVEFIKAFVKLMNSTNDLITKAMLWMLYGVFLVAPVGIILRCFYLAVSHVTGWY